MEHYAKYPAALILGVLDEEARHGHQVRYHGRRRGVGDEVLRQISRRIG